MSRPVRIFWPAADAAAVCIAQQPAAAGAFIINGSLASADDSCVRVATFTNLERVVSITSGGNVSGTQFTIAGTLRGKVVSQTIPGPDIGISATVYTTQAFTTVTSVTVNNGPAAAASIGTGNTGSTIWFPSDYYRGRSSLLVAVFVENGGTVSYSFETTPNDPFDASIDFVIWKGIDGVTTPTIPTNTPMINCAVDSMANYTLPTNASRIYVNSSDDTVGLDITFLEQGVL
jgi:hypothetical protein